MVGLGPGPSEMGATRFFAKWGGAKTEALRTDWSAEGYLPPLLISWPGGAS